MSDWIVHAILGAAAGYSLGLIASLKRVVMDLSKRIEVLEHKDK